MSSTQGLWSLLDFTLYVRVAPLCWLWRKSGAGAPCAHIRFLSGNLVLCYPAYELSKIEGKSGSPEKPLSDLGAVSYKSYWSSVLLDMIRNRKEDISIQDLCKVTSITPIDVTETLKALSIIHYISGDHVLRIPEKLLVPKEVRLVAFCPLFCTCVFLDSSLRCPHLW